MSPACEAEAKDYPPASIVLERLLAAMPQDRVSVGWLHEELREHSFEMLAFIMALIGVLPGASVMIGLLMIVPAFGMMFSSGMPLPDVVAARSISTRQASFILGRAIPLLKSWETAERVPQGEIWRFARPVVGLLLLLLGATLLVPVPLSNVLPALVIAGLALASFEGNLVLLCISGAGAAGSLAITAVTLLAASQAFAHFGL
ncbi:MAG TPA: exopolysaccharide biosynthesis protein [Rhizomicrobium sp.]|nr:exopolysaccharide biosynthesis protein [Rhizomicrobium sp.]